MMSLSVWVKANLEEYLTGKHLNFVIPGQLSYNDKSIIKEAGLFVMVSGKPHPKSLHYFLSALALGSGVSVACATEDAYATWKGILDIAWKAGFSRANLDVSLISEKSLPILLADPHYSYMYADQYLHHHERLYKNLLPSSALTENMRLVLSEADGVSLLEPAMILDQFVWTRSLAINTMRHGAPLELSV